MMEPPANNEITPAVQVSDQGDTAQSPRQKSIEKLIEAGRPTRFPPGTSGNPKGRPQSAGMSVKEYWNSMQRFTAVDLQAVLDDPASGAAEKLAAKTWISAIENGVSDPGRGIIDHTAGKAVQSIEMSIASDWNNEPSMQVSPETIALQHHLAKQLSARQEQQALPPPDLINRSGKVSS
jgi:hypothetical protein